LVVVSTLIHLSFLVFDFAFKGKPPVLIEDAVDVDLMTDLDLQAPQKSILPNAEKAPEAKVPAQLLPQLPKQFSVKEDEKPEDTVADELEKPLEKPKEEAKPVPEPKKADEPVVKTENKVDNPIEQKELLKRAALEKLRKDAKFANKPEAPEKGSLAALADALNTMQNKKGPTAGSAGAKGRANVYMAKVKKAVQANYAVPEAYNLRNASLQVTLMVAISERGDLLNLDVEESSGDATFDDMALEAIRNSAPLPQPPKELVGEPFRLVFTPKTL
jgi:TonB family protein